ncbi:uncharacterized protein LOC129288216 [Prosopis cineraria]|uniref:uncharacterized protein LOC129288216 n=1 Tax=Prosopis cineraria TaxID=364024 RepID=UPI002410B55E|nr:uncharacterized protein LOC129288216 [Prosopis cineraria]
MEFVATMFGKVLDLVVDPVKRQLGYLWNYKSNLEELRGCAQRLKDERQSMIARVREAERNGENIEDRVNNWLTEMDEKIAEIDMFLGDEDHLKTGCSNSSFPNLRLRHKLGRKAKKMNPACADLVQQANFTIISYRPEPIAIDAALFDGGYELFSSREAIIEEVMNALRDSTITMIGILGQGGVGKTTLAKAVARKAMAEKLFNVVVTANITSTPDVRRIQGEIADMLGLRLDDESEIGRAGRLLQRLKKEKESILVILDDLWAGLDLNMLGIPSNDDDVSQMTIKDMHDFGPNMLKTEKRPGGFKRCKILLTSRIKGVLLSEMDVKENSIFSVEVLEENDAEKLFNKVAGISDEDSAELKSLSTKIANKCAKLPVALVTAGKALKNNKSKYVWENALQEIERQELVGVLEPVEISTKLSYDHLKREDLKSIFILCAQMGEDLFIMDLVKYCIGLGIFQGVTVKEARDRTNMLINKLKDSSLLLNTSSYDCITMHDMIRDAALSIASKEKDAFTLRYGKLDEWPDKDTFERYTSISFHHCDIVDDIPEGINCPRLKVFHLNSKEPCLKIPDKLFEGMGELRVLILSGIDLLNLPSSIKCLKKLRKLCLEQCLLGENISIIGELENLRILSLSGSRFEIFPSEVRKLGKLQLLDISNCSKLQVIPSNVISMLNNLEELYMGNNLIQWDVERKINHNGIASLIELNHLQQLRSLDIHIPDIVALPRSLSFDKLDSFKIVIGDSKMLLLEDFKMPFKYESTKALALHLRKGDDIHSQTGIKMLFKSIEQLFLGEVDGLQNIIYELNVEGLPSLKHLTIIKNLDIQYIIYSRERKHQAMAFPKLESMCLYNLERIEKICNCQLTDASFRNLKAVKIKICGRLKNVFSSYMVRFLTKLETIEVSDCDSLKYVVVVERQENTTNNNNANDDSIAFPQLRTLILQSLPVLACFYAIDKNVPVSQIEATTACHPLFNAKVSFPSLESLELSSINVKEVWGDQPFPSASFQNLTKLIVKDCGSLKYLVSSSLAKSLMKLQSLFIRGCDMMMDIFDAEDVSSDEAGKEVDVFPQLKKIEITSMKNLKSIWHGHASLHSFCCLESLIIKDCAKLVTIFPQYMVGKFHNLGSMEVINCELVNEVFDLQSTSQISGRNETNLRNLHLENLPKLKHVWSRDPQGILNFKNFQDVSFISCPGLENLFPFSVAINLMKLESIEIRDCVGMKEIVTRDDTSNIVKFMFEFPKLTSLTLVELPKLRSFYQGSHGVDFQALTELGLTRCDKLEAFGKETGNSELKPILSALVKVLSNLEKLALGPKEWKWLQDSVGSNMYQMHNIKHLLLDRLSSIEILLWFLQRVPNLEVLYLWNSAVKHVSPNGSLVSLQKIGTVGQLKELRLLESYLPQNICLENDGMFQRVERLYIYDCHHLKNLLPSPVSFIYLTYLKVWNCGKLKNLISSSTAKSLVELTVLKVAECEMMEEIITVEENAEDTGDEIVFGKLKILKLESLRDLTSFCNSKDKLVFGFPSLEKLIVSNCSKLENFCEKIQSTPNLRKVNIEEGDEGEKGCWEGDLDSTIRKIFVDKLAQFARDVQYLKLGDYPKLQEIWHGVMPVPDGGFNKLKTLIVHGCHFLSNNVIPSHLLGFLYNLEYLKVQNCDSVKAIFEVGSLPSPFPIPLKTLILEQLPDLENVWNVDPQEILSFQSLQLVFVNGCGSLKSLFPASMSQHKLERLEILRMQCCGGLVEIVANDEIILIGANSNSIMFPSLTRLHLQNLPQLKCIYPVVNDLEWPKLKVLDVYHCDQLKVLPTREQDHFPIDVGAMVSFEKNFPNIEQLSLNKEDFMRINSQGQSHANFLCKLKCLILQCFHDFLDAFPCELFQKESLPNLEMLQVACSAFKEIFSSQRPNVDLGTKMLSSHLKGLELFSLRHLVSIGLEKSWAAPTLENLETLRVEICPCLKNLVSSAVSFTKLRELRIYECQGLVYLLTLSTARSLVSLEELSIGKCGSIQEIVPKEDASDEDEITFEKLKRLSLYSLQRLGSFHLGILH